MTILLIYIAIIYGVLRLIEFGLVKAWRHWRSRNRHRGDEIVRVTGRSDDGPRRARPQLRREPPAEAQALPGASSRDGG